MSRFDTYGFTFTVEISGVSTIMHLTVGASCVSTVKNHLSKQVAIRQLWIKCRNKSRFDSYELSVEISRDLTVMN